MGGTQFLSDPTDQGNIVQSVLEGTGVGRYGKFGNTTGKFCAKVYDSYFNEEDETTITPGIPVNKKPLIAEVSQVEVQEEPEEIELENEVEETEEVNEDPTELEENTKKKKFKRKRKKLKLFGKNQKIRQQGGESEDMILDLDPSEIQQFVLGGYIVEEI